MSGAVPEPVLDARMLLSRELASAQVEHDRRVHRRGYEQALADLRRLHESVREGRAEAARHKRCELGLRMGVAFLLRMLAKGDHR